MTHAWWLSAAVCGCESDGARVPQAHAVDGLVVGKRKGNASPYVTWQHWTDLVLVLARNRSLTPKLCIKRLAAHHAPRNTCSHCHKQMFVSQAKRPKHTSCASMNKGTAEAHSYDKHGKADHHEKSWPWEHHICCDYSLMGYISIHIRRWKPVFQKSPPMARERLIWGHEPP